MAQSWLGCGSSAQQARRAEIFVDVRPMEAEACAADAPVLALGFRGVEEPRVPDEGDDDGSLESVGCRPTRLPGYRAPTAGWLHKRPKLANRKTFFFEPRFYLKESCALLLRW